jgi:hypothetical protein
VQAFKQTAGHTKEKAMAEEQQALARDFISSFKGALEQVAVQAPSEEPVFLSHLRSHFGTDPTRLPILGESFEQHDHPNLHLALDAYLAELGRRATVIGIATPHEHMSITLSQLVAPAHGGLFNGPSFTEGPVEYVNITLDNDRVLACIQSGLYLIDTGADKLAVLVRGPRGHGWGDQKITLHVMAAEQPVAEAFLAQIRTTVRRRNVYRGHVISLDSDRMGEIVIRFHRLPAIGREAIILPGGLLERIERQTVDFSRLSDRLLSAGRHLKRGLLLYGPPGTGKTLTAMYLAGRMTDRTVLLLTGSGVGLIEKSCALARLLQPATVILEDVDLIAQERTHQSAGCNALLFELLNQMDGLADDADVLFMLTTNRPDLLEPALAARPGRVDMAIEIPLPNADCRRRLLQLYGAGLDLRLREPERLVTRTEGVSSAFVRELLRKAALFAADSGSTIVVDDRHVEEALHELVVEGGTLTKSLLGASQAFPPNDDE